jgi:hypothetical protein
VVSRVGGEVEGEAGVLTWLDESGKRYERALIYPARHGGGGDLWLFALGAVDCIPY